MEVVPDLTLSFPWETADEAAAATLPETAPHLRRAVADSSDRVAWLRARSRGVTATDAARFTSHRAVQSAAYDKLHGTGFTGNAFTEYGREREPLIAAWVQRSHGIRPSNTLYHAAANRRHLATPDGLAVRDGGRVELAEIKTTSKAFRSVPRSYLRQVWWQQYVLGADRTLFVWEEHRDFVPLDAEPRCCWVDRDENEIAMLVTLADRFLVLLATGGR
jgi:hypothetical protein